MENRENYIKPAITSIELEAAGIIATSGDEPQSFGFDEGQDSSPARVRQRDFWGGEEE